MKRSSDQIDISVVMTAHQEGLLAGPSGKSAQQAIAVAEAAGLRCQTIVVLDRADSLTGAVVAEVFGGNAHYLTTSEGDPGQARNRGIEMATGDFVALLDGDDLWSENWLAAAYDQAKARPDAVHHPACLLRFGNDRHLFWHVDSESPLCDKAYLDWMNYWDALSFARTDLYRRFPFRRNDLELAFGHEDWHWNAWTISEGVAHKPVAETFRLECHVLVDQRGVILLRRIPAADRGSFLAAAGDTGGRVCRHCRLSRRRNLLALRSNHSRQRRGPRIYQSDRALRRICARRLRLRSDAPVRKMAACPDDDGP
ncbi:glycosyltransferase involved in cell wall biosynthesis [Neorhizobium galegae]|uniref:glycosyltransferase n=1 Tax=Neorhizobium galegae TaxID=399 RepID=UPI001AEB311E|nr:glycosyltransferase [Neorhizobium galegae]MBP2550978.1 glycosyltransferase involved in cell wall biosynthesis [Neorhizobium galegae]